MFVYWRDWDVTIEYSKLFQELLRPSWSKKITIGYTSSDEDEDIEELTEATNLLSEDKDTDNHTQETISDSDW